MTTKTNEMDIPTLTLRPTQHLKHKVRDIALADFGRKEITLAEVEMPGFVFLFLWGGILLFFFAPV